RRFAEVREEMNARFELVMRALAEQKGEIDKRFAEQREEIDRRFRTVLWVSTIGFTVVSVLVSIFALWARG
ncbi:MAG: hypothetical protein RMJ57_00385, partial [Bacteroidia bacterium]|nr:hypothetical protein [Bacteroidia bacterium]